jgi:acetylglutamate kinase
LNSKVIVVKLGGSTLGNHDSTLEDIVYLQKQGRELVVIHGGGNLVSEWLSKQGVSAKFIHGERVTDKPALDMVTAVLAGLVNKEIVAAITGLGGKAVGISGVDGGLIQSRIKTGELGYVGEIEKVNAGPLTALLQARYVPVVAPVSFFAFDRSADAPQILNINGDPAAGEIASAIGAERLVFLTDVIGICDKAGKLLPRLSANEAEALVAAGVITGGMIPKVRAGIKASSAGAVTRIIDGKQPHALRNDIEGKSAGTSIVK